MSVYSREGVRAVSALISMHERASTTELSFP